MPFLFLSPSTQSFNSYVNTGNERYWMNQLADRMIPYLHTSGINVTRNDPEGTVGTSVRKSNAGSYDFHLALHSNAAPETLSGQIRGVDIYYYPGSTNALRMANIIVDNLKEVYPLPDRVRTVASSSLYELRETRAPSVLCELGYHDNLDDALWLQNNLEAVARSLSLSVTEYFGLPFLSPQPEQRATVRTVSGSLNIRGGPSASFPVLLQAPQNAALDVLGAYNGWYVVRYDGTIGYALGEYLRIL